MNSTFVFDYTNTLSIEQVASLNKQIMLIKDSTKAQIAVVLYDDFEKGTESDITLQIMRSWGVGDKVLNNGIVYLISPKQRITRIEVGRGLEGNIPDILAKEIQVGARDFYRRKDWAGGINSILITLYPHLKVEEVVQVKPVIQKNTGEILLIAFISLIILIIIVVRILMHSSKKRSNKPHNEEVNNRTKIDYWEKAKTLVTNFNNHSHSTERKVQEALVNSKSKLGYEYSHEVTFDKKALDKKIEEIMNLNEDKVRGSSLEHVSGLFYSLTGLIRSYNNLPRNIDMVVNGITKKRKDYDDLVAQVKNLHATLASKHGHKEGLDLKKEKYNELILVSKKKENYYDSLMSLMLYYESLTSRHNSKTNLNKSRNSVLTPIAKHVKKVEHVNKREEDDNSGLSTIAAIATVASIANDDSPGWGSNNDTPSDPSPDFSFGGGSSDSGGASDTF